MSRKVAHFTGLDLGQVSDPTALVVLEQVAERDPLSYGAGEARFLPPRYDVRHLERLPLGTSYVDVAARVKPMFAEPPLAGSLLVVDRTGVGRAVFDQLRGAGINAKVKGVTITAGSSVTPSDLGCFNVPKRELVGVLQVLLQTKRLRIASTLPEAATLIRELETFRAKINLETGHESLEAWRTADHDDIVLALACAAWAAERPRPRAGAK